MSRSWIAEFYVCLLVVALAWGLGWLLDYPSGFASCALLACLAWQFRQAAKFQAWLRQGLDHEPPDARGVWGDLMDQLFVYMRERRVERKWLEFELSHLKDSFAVLREGVVVISRTGMMEWCNLSAERLLGLRMQQDRHHPVLNYLRDPSIREYFARGEFADALELFSPAHPELRLQLRVSEFGNGDRMLVFSDITKIHQLEQMRKDFVSNASHELRTPLTVIRGYLETMQDAGDKMDPRLHRAVDQMVDQAKRMDELLGDLLKLSSLETLPQGAHEPVDIPALCHAVAADVAAAAIGNHKDIVVEPGEPLQVLGHAEELRSAISNLVMNAARYSGDGATVRLRWGIWDGKVRIAVEDNGIGIAPQHLPRLTERFYRVDSSRTRGTGGTGLGLAIVKHVLLRHNGELRIESELGKGCCFTCELPIDRVCAI